MSEFIDVETLYRQERQQWMKEEAPRRSLRGILTGSAVLDCAGCPCGV